MPIFVVRADKKTPRLNRDNAQATGYCFIGWSEMGDLTHYLSWQGLHDALCDTYPTNSKAINTKNTNQIWHFMGNETEKSQGIQINDVVATPLPDQRIIRFGQIIGDYEYQKDNPLYTEHCRKIKWLQTISRDKIDKEHIKEFDHRKTVHQINLDTQQYIVNNFL